MCRKCKKMSATLVLIVGVLLLLKDLNVIGLAGIQPWTFVFLLFGLIGCAKGCCSECQSCAMPEAKAMPKGKKK